MQSRIGWTWFWALAGIVLMTNLAWAQSGGEREGRWGGDRGERGDRESRWGGDRGEGRGERRRFDPADFLRRLDTNGNGQIDPNEGEGRWRGFVDQAATRAGLDPKQPLPLDKLTESMQQRAAERESERSGEEQGQPNRDGESASASSTESSSGASSNAANAPAAAPLVPGFGVATNLSLPPGFDVPLERTGGRYARPLEERFERTVIERVDQMLREYDKNKNMLLEYKTSEAEGITWRFPPEQSDRNNDGRLDREELCYRIAKVLGSREREASDRGSERSGSDRGGRGSGGSSSSGDSAESQQAKVRRYAEGLLKQYDKNGSGVLERDEWSTMRGDYEKADTNGDKILTVDELAARLASYGSREDSSSGRGSGSGYSGGGGDSRRGGYRSREERTSDSGEKKSYRFLTPLERLPKGLPSWFTRNDVDGDAQVTMAEYSSTFNDTIAAEFAKYDRNGDGVITAAECLQVESSKTARK